MKRLLLILLFINTLYAQNDTLKLTHYYQVRDTVHNRLIFKNMDDGVIQGTVKKGDCYTVVEAGVVTGRMCYDKQGGLLSRLYKTPSGYVMETYGTRITKKYFDGMFNSVAEEECNEDGSLAKKVVYEKYFEISSQHYYEGGKELFRLEYHNGMPEFLGDTLAAEPANGVVLKNDTLYAMHRGTVMAYKYYANGRLRQYWSETTRFLWDAEGGLTHSKLYKRSQQVFEVKHEDYFEYCEYAGNGSISLKVCASGGRVGSIAITQPGRTIEIGYSLGQLQEATIREPIEGGSYVTRVKQNGTATKTRFINNSNGTTTQDPVKGFEFFHGGYDYNDFLKTANILTLQEYESICSRALKL
ncbi:hypothetical protein AM493_15285 [Flavobacterium akiainvivens]|uniref:Uncharacterized protein n=1 Tax=Flavobacterium akiainvivens TaxID=1202724 RepID=A0A0M8MJS3_9FLAO|nr:hypothetical protein [Flavobacterium akiainvivens]KOS07247.1 hypothetical protein AM493_15285 [Flavobacterium akiainvivens]SFQ45591.1 hypothetical protein SAMN05444144_10539 [Flavobacterium akiainvivens]